MNEVATEYEVTMAARLRRHMLTSGLGMLAGIAAMVAGGALSRTLLDAGAPRAALAVLPMLGLLLIPGVGFYSTFTNLRCPHCNKLVALETSWNASLFASASSGACMGCGTKIFGELVRRRFQRTFLVAFAGGLGLGVVGAVLSALSHR